MSSIYDISRIGVHRDLNHWFVHETCLIGVREISILFIGRVGDVAHLHRLRHHFSIPKRRCLQFVHTLSPRVVCHHLPPWLCHTLLPLPREGDHNPCFGKNTVSHITGRQQALHFSGKRPPPIVHFTTVKAHPLPSPYIVILKLQDSPTRSV